MKIVKLNAINSTNTYLKELVKEKSVENWTVICAEYQTSGRGQMQTVWESERGKNLMFSVLVNFEGLSVDQHFYLNCAVSLAVFNVLKLHKVANLSIKWPNDIMSGSRKICGILIENNLKGPGINYSVIGVGLNVNQKGFSEALPNAVSMKMQLGKTINRDELLIALVVELKKQIEKINGNQQIELYNDYTENLYQKNIFKYYKTKSNKPFLAKIVGVNLKGELELQSQNGRQTTYQFKEITYL